MEVFTRTACALEEVTDVTHKETVPKPHAKVKWLRMAETKRTVSLRSTGVSRTG